MHSFILPVFVEGQLGKHCSKSWEKPQGPKLFSALNEFSFLLGHFRPHLSRDLTVVGELVR